MPLSRYAFVLLSVWVASGALGACSPSAEEEAPPPVVSLLGRFAFVEEVASFGAGARARGVEADGRERPAIVAHAPSLLRFRAVPIHRGARLEVGTSVPERRGKNPDGVAFVVRLSQADAERELLHTVELPPEEGGTARVTKHSIELQPWEGLVVDLELEMSPRESRQGDLGAWVRPRIVAAAPHPAHGRTPVRIATLLREIPPGEELLIHPRQEQHLATESLVPRQARGQGPDLLLIVVDTLRRDHMGLHGYGRETTPFLSRFSGEAMVFEDAVSASSWTMPATASMLTGLHPIEHGVTDARPLSPEASTIAERAQELGLSTVGVSANPIVGPAEGFAQGHEAFVHLPWARAEAVNGALLDLLGERGSDRWFAYVHYIDPHDPYEAPLGFLGTYGSAADQRPSDEEFRAAVDSVNFTDPPADIPEVAVDAWIDAYDEEIRYWDSTFAELLESLEAGGLLRDDTIIVVTSDHGEEFMEHGRLKHGLQLYQESLAVPLVVRARGSIPAGRDSRPVETRRLPELCLRLLEAAGPIEDAGSLLRPSRGLLFSHTSHAPSPLGRGRTELLSVRDGRWKLIHMPEARAIELFDLVADPGETRDVASTEDQVVQRAMQILERWTELEQMDSSVKADAEVLEKLKALGYVQ